MGKFQYKHHKDSFTVTKNYKQEKISKVVVLLPLIVLITVLLFLTSCSTTQAGCGSGFTWGAAAMDCPAYR